MALWMIRGGRKDEKFDVALQTGHAILGWDEVGDIRDADSRTEIQKLVAQAYPDRPESWPSWTGQFWRFLHDIAPGDLICMPHKKDRTVVIGRWTGGGYRYRSDFRADCRHTAPVDWQRQVHLAELSGDLRTQLNRQGTVAEIKGAARLAEIMALLWLPISAERPEWITGAPEGALEGERQVREQTFLSRDYYIAAAAWSENVSRYGIGTCEVCKFEADDRGMFDVHHLNPIAQRRRKTKVTDLLVLCPRCHRRAHRKAGPMPYTLNELMLWVTA